MKRIFKVKLSNVRYQNDTSTFEVVANDAHSAIDKAKTQAVRESRWRGGFIVEEVFHRGPAV